MRTVPCWTIDELQVRYELEPQLRDLFVEGVFDREVYSQVVKDYDEKPVIYEIDVVDVPDHVLEKYGMSSGNKQRVIALATELDSIQEEASISCLVDRDLDHWFDELPQCRYLRWSIYASIECHYISRETVSDIVLTTAKAKIGRFESYYISLLNVLRDLYALRLADRQMQLHIKWVALRKYIESSEDEIVFDIEKYTIALMTSNKIVAVKQEYIDCYLSWREKLNGDVRLSARGHDFTQLLAWTIKERQGQKEFASEGAIERLYVLLARTIPTMAAEIECHTKARKSR